MEVYEFEKSVITRYKELIDVLQWNDCAIPASEVKAQWAYFIELCIEPTGWQALWKVPRVICEEIKIRYPTVVFGIVEHVLFKELKAVFTIVAVEDDNIQLPERQEVLLEDLWVTKKQENTELNIDKTADCIDQLRFFYKYIWMPWDSDNDDDLDWVKKHLESRIRFYDDLKKNNMKKSVANHIRMLLFEAYYIQRKCDYLELELSDDEIDEIHNNISKDQITDLMKLHLRMAMIKSEIELLENPDMRKVYEDMQDDSKKQMISTVTANDTSIIYLVTMLNTITAQINLLQMIKDSFGNSSPVLILNSLQQALDNFKSCDRIILSPGEHHIKVIEHLNDGNICGLADNKIHADKSNIQPCRKAVIKSKDDDITLLSINGDLILENLVLDCRNVRNGISIKHGNVMLKNCEIIGDGMSSTKKGVVVSGSGQLTMNKCLIRNFAIGLSLNNSARIDFHESQISKCKIGIELKDEAHIKFENSSTIADSKEYGIWYETSNQLNVKNMVLMDESEFPMKQPWSGKCLFERNYKGNIIVWNKDTFFSSFMNIKLSESYEEIVSISSDCGSISEDNYNTPNSSLDNKTTILIDDSVVEVGDE